MQSCRSFLLLSVLLPLLAACGPEMTDHTQQISLTNQAAYALEDKPIRIAKASLSVPDGMHYPRLITAEGDTIASQLDDIDDDGQWDELFFVVNLAASDTLALTLDWAADPGEYTRRTSVRFGKRDSKDTPVHSKTSDTLTAATIHARMGYQPYQTDGPSWENDKAGFRHYFDGRNSKDLFGKTTSAMSPDDVGIGEGGKVEDNYHVMADWGRDVLSTASAVGLGGLALQAGEEVLRLGNLAGDTITNFDHAVFKIVEEGPVHSIIQFNHYGWQPRPDRNYELQEVVDIWPGMYAYHGVAQMKGLQGDETLLVGLVNNNTEEALTELTDNEKYVVLYTHDKQTYDKTWWLGMALLVPKSGYLGASEAPDTGLVTTSYFARMKIANDQPVEYYALGAWELSDPGFADSTYFVNHVKHFADQLSAEVSVEVR